MKVWIVEIAPGQVVAVASTEAKAQEAVKAYKEQFGPVAVKISTWTVDGWER